MCIKKKPKTKKGKEIACYACCVVWRRKMHFWRDRGREEIEHERNDQVSEKSGMARNNTAYQLTRLDIAVHVATLVNGIERSRGLPQPRPCMHVCDIVPATQAVIQVAVRCVFLYKIIAAFTLNTGETGREGKKK